MMRDRSTMSMIRISAFVGIAMRSSRPRPCRRTACRSARRPCRSDRGRDGETRDSRREHRRDRGFRGRVGRRIRPRRPRFGQTRRRRHALSGGLDQQGALGHRDDDRCRAGRHRPRRRHQRHPRTIPTAGPGRSLDPPERGSGSAGDASRASFPIPAGPATSTTAAIATATISTRPRRSTRYRPSTRS